MRPTLGIQLILGGQDFQSDLGASLLSGLLESLRPAFFDQFIVVNSGIDKNSQQLLRSESTYRKSIGLSPLKVVKRKWTDDFAAARQAALDLCETDWWLWVDSDDTIYNIESIRDEIEHADEDCGGFFAPYMYAFDEYGNVITQHDRERIFRTSIGWDWRGRIHETVWPHKGMTWERAESAAWIHQRGLDIKSDRNLPLLQAWHEEEPDNIRVWLYLGNQYFAEGSYGLAGQWYDRVWRSQEGSHIDRYNAMTYSARAWRSVGDVKRAIVADMAGVTEFPETADSYIGMCENFIHLKQWKKGVAMGETALTKDVPNSIMFRNDLDYTWRLQNDLAICYAGDDQVERALECAELALSFRPDDAEGQNNVRIYGERVEKEKALSALDSLALGDGAVAVALALPEDLRSERKARDIWVPALLKETYRGTQPRITFYCGPSLEDWNGDTPKTKGIGGSETAVVEVAARLAKEGWNPIVYNSTGNAEGEYDGVTYAYWERFRAQSPSDVFVAWRNPHMIDEQPVAKEKWLWMHDLHSGDRLTPERGAQYDKVLGVSQWHRDHMKALYPFLDNLDYVENGVDLSRFDQKVTREPWRFIYASSPDRGLGALLKFWPMIHQMESAAELHIFYGWESFLAQATQGSPGLLRQYEWIQELGKHPGVVWRGRVSQGELAKEMLAASVWAHPTSFLETFCITAVEAMAAGLMIVSSHTGNIPNIVGDAGITISGNSGSIAYGRQFIPAVHGAMADVGFQAQFHGIGPSRAKLFSWERAMDRWKGMLMKVNV